MSLSPRIAAFVAGIAAGALARRWQTQGDLASPFSIQKLGRQVQLQLEAQEKRVAYLEARVGDHETKLKQIPDTAQLMGALDELLGEAMTGMGKRLTAQAQSIETMQVAVTYTDELLEQVLESLDKLGDAARKQTDAASDSNQTLSTALSNS